jgi:hypothetical protein
MDYARRWSAAPLARYFLCAAVAILATGCGADGGGSASSGTPATLPTGAPQTVTAPSITGTPATTVVAGSQYSFQPSVSDTNGDALTFSVENMPSWMTFDTTSGVLSGTPSASNVGRFQSITLSVSNGKAIAQLTPFSIEVTVAPPTTPTPPPNSSPTITGTPATSVQAGSHYAFQPSAADADKDTLVFTISGQPLWTSFNASTGQLSGTPSSSNVGTYSNIMISVSDGKATVSLLAFKITVTAIPPAPPTNSPPKITGTPSTSVQAGTAYSFQPAITDPDGNTLTFSIANKPSWATFSTTTGHLMGTPAMANIGAYSNITISVSDGTASVSLPSFSIQVTTPPVIPPTIGGAPPTRAQVGMLYSFTPTASDPSGKTLSFSVQNKPSWLTFSIATGQLSGTPESTDVGTDPNIVICASDGSANAALTAFSITVAAAPKIGTATVKWVAPTQNTDGSTVTNLSGYVLWYGTSSSSLSQAAAITNPATTSYTIQNLGQGTWYFAVAATSGNGTQSGFSTVVSKTIP